MGCPKVVYLLSQGGVPANSLSNMPIKIESRLQKLTSQSGTDHINKWTTVRVV